jgi:pimeloyl-ACP methyl ester carboxylesterase
MPGLAWAPVQREIAKFTKACWYDRAGYGWSDPGPFPNHSDSVARDLHKLLSVSGHPPPYVLVGHSAGGLDVRVFNGMYPNEVAGMVLVDPTPEDILEWSPGIPAPDWLQRPVHLATEFAGAIGLVPLFAPDPGPPPLGFTPVEWSTISNLRWQVKSRIASVNEGPLRANTQLVKASHGKLIVLPAIGQASEAVSGAVREIIAGVRTVAELRP